MSRGNLSEIDRFLCEGGLDARPEHRDEELDLMISHVVPSTMRGRFCDLYASWKRKLGVTMRQVHRAGEKVFIDYSGTVSLALLRSVGSFG